MPIIQICGSCGATIGTYPTLTKSRGKTYAEEIAKTHCPACGIKFSPRFKLEVMPVG